MLLFDKIDVSSVKHRVPGSSNKFLTGQRFEGKHKDEASRSNAGMVRKDTKSVGIGSATGTSRLVVGVANSNPSILLLKQGLEMRTSLVYQLLFTLYFHRLSVSSVFSAP